MLPEDRGRDVLRLGLAAGVAPGMDEGPKANAAVIVSLDVRGPREFAGEGRSHARGGH